MLEKDGKSIGSAIPRKSSVITRSNAADILQETIRMPHLRISHRNMSTMTSVSTANKMISAKPQLGHKKVQTSPQISSLLSVPVPIYVPVPMAMFSVPFINPVPIPIPIPIPILIPTTANSSKEILKDICRLRNEMPADPIQAELLQIADLLADNENNNSDKKTTVKQEEIVRDNNGPEVDFSQSFDSPDGKRRKISETFLQEEQLPRDSDDGADKAEGMRLAYTLGINAWKQWMTNRKFPDEMIIKTEILDMTPDELNFYLCLFVKELRKPNGDEYAPDTIYYLCLGLQYYLDRNNRTENIFIDQRFEAFTDCLDMFAKKFCDLYYDESSFIVTRVEEEHLWETKQLGCHSPHVLLNTLIYYNTKYFYRSTVDEHLELSFHHIVRVYKKKSGSSSTMLRFFPRSRMANDKRVYEQEENTTDRIKCPVKLYEYYLSKCPESVKNEFSSIYLSPEKYCISDSPLWFSTTPLPRASLEKIVNRAKMVKEVNVALLTINP